MPSAEPRPLEPSLSLRQAVRLGLTMPLPRRPEAATPMPALAVGPWWQIQAKAAPAEEAAPASAEVLIYGDIGESWDGETVAAKEFVVALQKVQGAALTVRINSYGGSVTDGLAIHNALQRQRAHGPVSVEVDGVAASAASLIAMAGDSLIMADNALLMIHAPWGGCLGNAADMREMATTLDRYAQAMAGAYVRPEFSREQALALLSDGADHWYTAAEALAAGLVDRIGPAAPVAAAVPARYQARAALFTAAVAPVAAAIPPSLSAPTGALPEELPMSDQAMPQPSAPNVAEITATAQTDARAVLARRNQDLKARYDAFRAAYPGTDEVVRGCYDAAMADIDATAEGFTAAVLAKLAEGPGPVAGAHTSRASMVEDEADKRKEACAVALLSRAAIKAAKPAEMNGNPFRGKTLARIAEDSLVRAGARVAGLDPMQIVAQAFTQSTSDFPVLMENVMHKSLLAGYAIAADSWRRWCAVGSVSDFRAHNRYMLGSIDELDLVLEAGEFQTKPIPDGRKQSVSVTTRGNILTLTRQAIINDDLGAFVGLANARGRAAARTIENAVYAAISLNSGYGPALSDGKTIIHADHDNLVTGGTAPTVEAIEKGMLLFAAQKDISGHDYLDLTPTIALVPKGLEVTTRVLNTSTNDPAATGSTKNFLTPNPYQGVFSDIVASPRLVATKWYMLCSPDVAPVLEVSFLNGVQEPVMEMEQGFSVDGVSWKTRLDFGVSGVGYEGIVLNPGT